MDHGNTAPRSAHLPLLVSAPPLKPEPFDMAKWRKDWGAYWGARGREIGEMIRRMEA